MPFQMTVRPHPLGAAGRRARLARYIGGQITIETRWGGRYTGRLIAAPRPVETRSDAPNEGSAVVFLDTTNEVVSININDMIDVEAEPPTYPVTYGGRDA